MRILFATVGISSCTIPNRPHHCAATRQHGGTTEDQNLALACMHSNRFKGPNIAGRDADGEVVRLFNPRRDNWKEHFAWDGPELKALTAIGRVTIAVLAINDQEVLQLRKALQEEGAFGE